MSAADLFTGTSSGTNMSSLSLYLPFKSNHEEDRVTTQEPTHLKDSSPAPEDTFGEGPPEQVSVVGCSSRDTVNPSAERVGLGAGIRAPGDRGRVFSKNTKMHDNHVTAGESAW